MSTPVGTRLYAAPELLKRQRPYRPVAPALDLFSCGVVLYLLVCARFPFGPSDDHATPPDLSHYPWTQISPHGAQLVRTMLHPDPDQRPTAPQALSSPWFAASHVGPCAVLPAPAERVDSLRIMSTLSRAGSTLAGGVLGPAFRRVGLPRRLARGWHTPDTSPTRTGSPERTETKGWPSKVFRVGEPRGLGRRCHTPDRMGSGSGDVDEPATWLSSGGQGSSRSWHLQRVQ